MGVLYAKVDGTWTPILNSTGQFLPITGGNLTGPLLITGGGELDLTSTVHHLQLGASTGGNLAFDANEIQARNNGLANVLNLNPHGGNVWVGSDTIGSNLHLRGALPTGTPIDWYVGGQRVATMFTFGASLPVDIVIQALATYGRDISLQATDSVTFHTVGVERGRFDAGGNFMVGKATAGIANAGTQIVNTGTSLQVTRDLAGAAELILNHIGAHDAGAELFASFRRVNTTIGTIDQNGTSGVRYNTTSDYRLKHDHGPIFQARERIRVLKPRRVVWKDDPTQTEMDGFLAHQVAEVVPDAVTGEKDGEAMQQMDATRLIPLLTAALQEAHDRIDILEARLDALEAA